ncbi:unnamed protein product, partial [Urochloa humidicola]
KKKKKKKTDHLLSRRGGIWNHPSSPSGTFLRGRTPTASMATADSATAASFSRLSFRRAVCPSPLRLPLSRAHPPGRLRVSSTVVALRKRNPKRLKYAAERQFTRGDTGMLRVQVEPSGEDFWKLDPIIDLINRGAVGVIPTDTVNLVMFYLIDALLDITKME